MRRTVAAAAVSLALASAVFARSAGQAALDDGVERYRRGDFHGAAAAFRQAVDLDPSLMKAWENLGWAQHRLRNDPEALRIWRTLLKLEPGSVPTWNAVGEVELAREAWLPASQAFERSLEREPDQPEVRLRLGQSYEALGRNDRAASQYRAILDKHPGQAKAVQRLADLYERLGRLDDAETLLRGGRFDDRLARVLAKRGDDAYAREAWADAERDYRRAADLAPEDARYTANLGWALRRSGRNDAAIVAWKSALAQGAVEPAKLWRAMADALREEGRADAAREAYLEAARHDPKAGAPLLPVAELALQAGDVASAVSSLAEMFRRTPPTSDDLARAADLFIRAERLDEGQAFLATRGPAARPGIARIAAARGGAAYRAGDDASAVRHYREALAADPACRAALRDAGWVYWRRAEWDLVEKTWGDYAAAYPDAPEPSELLGRLHLYRGEPRRAIDDAERALARQPSDTGPATALLARALLADGRYVRGREVAASLATARPDDVVAQTLYGEALWRALDYEAARDQWRRVLDLGSTSPRALHYWLRSTYESGGYEEAIREAQALAREQRASEPVLRLLAEDAAVRHDLDGQARWYAALAERWPGRVPYWLALADVETRRGDFKAKERTLRQALGHHPRQPDLQLQLAEALFAQGRPARALELYDELGSRLGRNRTVFLGRVRALNDLGHGEEALALVDADRDGLLFADERALESAAILEGMGRREEAAARRARLATPAPGTLTVAVLLYHGLASHERTITMPIANFEDQMRALAEAGYEALTVSELDLVLAGKRTAPEKPILITFDDARADTFAGADPLLARFKLRGTMFVPTVRIAAERAGNADWASLKAFRDGGRWDFQSHGHLAHDPIPIDGDGSVAEFLVNRQWLPEAGRLESHEEFVARVESDYALCKRLLEEHLPGQESVAYAFPFSEMGQLHGGNDPDALAVNERAFGAIYRYGLVQDASGYNVLRPGDPGPILLRRLNVPREWDGERLLAHLRTQRPAAVARLDAARWDLWTGRLDRAERELRATGAGLHLASTLREQGRPHDAAAVLASIPEGPGWDPPDSARLKLAADLAWETEPGAGAEARIVSDADGRDEREIGATGRLSFGEAIDLWGEAGTVLFQDPVFPEVSGPQLTLGVRWQAFDHASIGGWLRGRSLSGGITTFSGEASVAGRVDRHRFGLACGVDDVPTAGALAEEIQERGCEGSYQLGTRLWRWRGRAGYRTYSDGNDAGIVWADGVRAFGARKRVALGAKIELADSAGRMPEYYTPDRLASLLALARYQHRFASRASIDAELGVGPSRDATAGSRIVARARAGFTQDWTERLRSTVTFEYGQTPDYHRTSLGIALGYRF